MMDRRPFKKRTAAIFFFAMLALCQAAAFIPQPDNVPDAIERVAEATKSEFWSEKRVRRAGQTCGLNGGNTTGVCTTISSISSSLLFCTGVASYTATEVCIGSAGVINTDYRANTIYNSYKSQLGASPDCLTAYKNFVCAVAFPQCVSGSSVYLCQSTCNNMFTTCGNAASESLNCATNPPAGIAIVAGSNGPSLSCTGAAGSLLPSIAFLAVTVIATLLTSL